MKSLSMCPFFFFFNLCVFQADALSWKKGVSCKIPIFTNIIDVFNRKTFTFCNISVITEDNDNNNNNNFILRS